MQEIVSKYQREIEEYNIKYRQAIEEIHQTRTKSPKNAEKK